MEIDVPKLVADCYRMTEAAQGTAGCIAFYQGAQWMREQIIAQPQQPAPVAQEPMTPDMFWAADDPETFGHEITDIVAGYGPGEVIKIDCAIGLPSNTVRATVDGDYLGYEIVGSITGAKT